MAFENSNRAYTGYVEKYIGTAYDKMAELHSRLEELLLISGAIEDGSFNEVAGIADEIQTLIDKLDEFNTTYYGALNFIPQMDPKGDAITDGDIYFDLNKELMYIFYRDTWTPLGAVASTVEHFIIGEGNIQDTVVTISDLNYPYLPGTHNLTVHRNGELLINKQVDVTYGEYTEIDERTIQFTLPTDESSDRLLKGTEEGDRITTTIGTEAATVTHVGRVSEFTITVDEPNQRYIELPIGETYIVGTNNLSVHVKENTGTAQRHYQVSGIDYYESGPTNITFEDPLAQGSLVTMTIGHITASDDAKYKVLMQISTPDVTQYDEGQLWFKEDTGRMFILYLDDIPVEAGGQVRQWISTAPEDIVVNSGYVPPAEELPQVIHGTVFSDLPPDPAEYSEGTLWFNNSTGNLHIKYYDGNTHQWVKVST